MLDLNAIEKSINEALAKETRESLLAWMDKCIERVRRMTPEEYEQLWKEAKDMPSVRVILPGVEAIPEAAVSDKKFPVIYITREEINDLHFDASGLTDEQMEEFARLMAKELNVYDELYWAINRAAIEMRLTDNDPVKKREQT